MREGTCSVTFLPVYVFAVLLQHGHQTKADHPLREPKKLRSVVTFQRDCSLPEPGSCHASESNARRFLASSVHNCNTAVKLLSLLRLTSGP